MSFEDLWEEVKKLGILPEAAHLDLAGVLEKDTKSMLERKSAMDVAEILMDAIREVENGSVETMDRLVRKRI